MAVIEETAATATATGTSIGMLQLIGQWAADRGHNLLDVVETVSGIPKTDTEDQAVAARAYFAKKKRNAELSIVAGSFVKAFGFNGTYEVVGFRAIDGTDGAQLRAVKSDGTPIGTGEFWLSLESLLAI